MPPPLHSRPRVRTRTVGYQRPAGEQRSRLPELALRLRDRNVATIRAVIASKNAQINKLLKFPAFPSLETRAQPTKPHDSKLFGKEH